MKKSITSQKQIFYLFNALCGVMVFLLTLSVNSLLVHGATSQNELPFEFDKVDNYNDWINQDIIESIDSYGLPIFDDDYVLTVLDFNYYGNEGNYVIYRGWFSLVPIDSFGSSTVNQDFYNSPLSYSKVSGLNSYYFGVHFDIRGGFTPIVFNVNSNYSDLGSLFGHSPTSVTILNTPYVFTSYVPAYFNKNFYSNNDNLVLEHSPVPLPDDNSGHASEPVDDHGHYIEDGNGNRIPKPNKPTPSVYIPPTIQFPTIDTSSLEKLVESLIDIVKYGISYIGEVINGTISNLLSNLDLWFDYLVSSFNYGINNIVGSIKDLAQTFYDNMVSLFEPFYDFFSGVANFFNSLIELGMIDGQFVFSTFVSRLVVPDVSDVVDLLIDHDAFGSHALFLASYHKIQFLINTFNSLQPIKVFSVPSTTWHGYTIGGFTVDFSWYDDFKVYMDLILSGFLIIGYLYWLFSSLNSLFRGTGSMVYDSLYETPTKGGEHH